MLIPVAMIFTVDSVYVYIKLDCLKTSKNLQLDQTVKL